VSQNSKRRLHNPLAPAGGYKSNTDLLILLLVVVLVAVGIVMVYSSTYYSNAVKISNKTDISQQFMEDTKSLLAGNASSGMKTLLKQLGGCGLGFAALFVLMCIDYHKYAKLPFAYLGVAVSVGLLIWALSSAEDTLGARRWIDVFGVSVQPSEVARLAMILFVSVWFGKYKKQMGGGAPLGLVIKRVSVPVAVAGGLCMLILLGKSLSMTATVGIVFVIMMVVCGVDKRILLAMGGGAAAFGGLAVALEPYRIKRVIAFIDPWSDPLGNGYQLIQSIYALANGGWTGVGLGNSRQKYLFLTFADSDFMLSVIGEEFGFIGIALLMLVYGVLIWRGITVAINAPDTCGMMMATGVCGMLAVQLLLHVAVISSSFPPTGVPLPFISSGNSSLIIFMASMGILLNISRQREKT